MTTEYFGAVIMPISPRMTISAMAKDTSGCTYAVYGEATMRAPGMFPSWLGHGFTLGVGSFKVTENFRNYSAPCMWPLNVGDDAFFLLPGVGGGSLDPGLPVSLGWGWMSGGDFGFNILPWELEGLQVWALMNIILGKFNDVMHAGPTCPTSGGSPGPPKLGQATPAAL